MKAVTPESFRRQWIFAAVVVTAIRLVQPVEPGFDLGAQIEAAQNLLAGHGLSRYTNVDADLSAPARLMTLTKFSSGYSLLTAALMTVGFDVLTIVKLLGAAATLIGWWGWGRLAGSFFSDGLNRGRGWQWAALLVATGTPLLFTPSWIGTDIFLWAAVPWVLECLTRGSAHDHRLTRRFDYLAGALCGLALMMRYASLFLALYAVAVILWQSRLRFGTLVYRGTFFALGIIPIVTPQLYINYVIANVPAASPGGLTSPGTLDNTVQRLFDSVSVLHTANHFWTFWIPGKIKGALFPLDASAVRLLFGADDRVVRWQLGIAVLGALVLALALKVYAAKADASREPRIIAGGLFFAIPLMLVSCMLVGTYDYAGDERYYEPLIPLSVLVGYSLAAMPRLPDRAAAIRLLRSSGTIYTAAYIGMLFVYLALLFAPGQIGLSPRLKLMAKEPLLWPLFRSADEISPARQLVMRLLKEEPNALLLTTRIRPFSWDPAVDRSRLIDLHCAALRADHVSGPISIVILTSDEGGATDLWYNDGNGVTGKIRRAECYEDLPGRYLVQRFPDEHLKVLTARVPAGQHVALRQP